MQEKQHPTDASTAACKRCIMTKGVDCELALDEEGICNHCRRYDALKQSRLVSPETRNERLRKLVGKIKRNSRDKEYDCIVGVSGGVDSTYVAYLVKELGLRPLAVHLDNGWNSELAVMNIERVLRRLDIDLVTHVLDWQEFRDLQVSFLKASTPDGEIPTDHAIFALLWREASRRDIKYIISGMNFSTESISVSSWSYGHSDWRYIKSVHAAFGSGKLLSYPHFSLTTLLWYNIVRSIKTVSILNYIDYNKEDVMNLLQEKLGWVYYGGKHYESIYTRFYQGYILPKKFGIDKRYGHLSDLINAGQISRNDALIAVNCEPYPTTQQETDKAYVIKKLQISSAEFEAIMARPIDSFKNYKNSYYLVQKLKVVVNIMRRFRLYPK